MKKNCKTMNNYMPIYQKIIMKWTHFQGKKTLPKLTQEEIEHLNRSITNNETELVIKKFSQRKVQDQMTLLVNSTMYLNEKEHQFLTKSFQKQKNKKYPQLILKQDKDNIRKQQTNIPCEYRIKTFHKVLTNQSSNIKNITYHN